jgi:hypothetical protein
MLNLSQTQSPRSQKMFHNCRRYVNDGNRGMLFDFGREPMSKHSKEIRNHNERAMTLLF